MSLATRYILPRLAKRIRWRSVRRIVNPVSLFFGPIFQKEMATLGRRKSTYIVRGGFIALLIAIVAIAFFAQSTNIQYESDAAQLQMFASIAPILAITLGWIQFVVLTLLAPMLTSTCICEEKTARTLSSLVTTPLISPQIIFGKLASRMMQVVILLLATTPILLLIRIYGGLQASTVLEMTSVTFSSAMLAGSIGLMYSVWHRKPWAVIIMSALTFGLLTVGPAILIGVLGTVYPQYQGVLISMHWLSPVFTLWLITADTLAGFPVVPGGNMHSWLWCSLTTLGLALCVNVFSSMVLRRVMLAESGGWRAGRGSLIPGVRLRRKRVKPAKSGAPTSPERTRRSRIVWNAPVLWRETHQPLLGSRLAAWLVLGAVGIGLMLLYIRADRGDVVLHYVLIWVFMILQVLMCCVASTSAIASERDARTLDVLLTTPLGTSAIVMDKFLGSLWRVKLIPLYILSHIIVYVTLGDLSWLTVVHIGVLVAGYSIFLCGTGLLLSVLCAKAIRASILNLTVGISAWIALPILTLILGSMFTTVGWDPDESVLLAIILAINPVYMAYRAIEGGLGDAPTWMEGPYVILDSMSAPIFSAYLIGGAIVFTMLGLGAVAIASTVFYAQTRRGL